MGMMRSRSSHPQKQRRLLEDSRRNDQRSADLSAHPLYQIARNLTKQVSLAAQETRKKKCFRDALERLSSYLDHPDDMTTDTKDVHLLLRHVHNSLLLTLSYHARLSSSTAFSENPAVTRTSPRNGEQAMTFEQQSDFMELLIDCFWRLYHSSILSYRPRQQEENHDVWFLLVQTFLRLTITKGNAQRACWTLSEVMLLECVCTLGKDVDISSVEPSFSRHCVKSLKELQQKASNSELEYRAKEAIGGILDFLEAQGEYCSLDQCHPPTPGMKASAFLGPWGEPDQQTQLDPEWERVLFQFQGLQAPAQKRQDWEESVCSTLLNASDDATRECVTEEVKCVLSVLVRRILVEESTQSCKNEPQTFGLKEDRRCLAGRMVLPMLGLLWKRPCLTNIPFSELSEIWQLLLTSSEDERMIHETAHTLCQLLLESSSEPQTYANHLDLLSALARAVVMHSATEPLSGLCEPFFSALESLVQHSNSSCHAAFQWDVVRQPFLLAAVTRGTTESPAAARLLVQWSSWALNYRVLAHHPSTVAAMIRLVRENRVPAGLEREEWKARILEIAHYI